MFIFFISSSSSFWKIYKTIVCSRAIVRGHPITLLLLLLNILIHPNKPKNLLVERCGCEFLFYSYSLFSERDRREQRKEKKIWLDTGVEPAQATAGTSWAVDPHSRRALSRMETRVLFLNKGPLLRPFSFWYLITV
jgi:hypothetical protein